MKVEERLLSRGKEYADKAKVQKERILKDLTKPANYVNRKSELYLIQSSDLRMGAYKS